MRPTEAIKQFHARAIDGAELMRALAGFDGWIVPAPELVEGHPDMTRAVILVPMAGEDGRPSLHLFMFSSAEALERAREALGPALGGSHLEGLPGWALWHDLDAAVDAVAIDAGSPDETIFERDRLARLREWGRILRVEAAIAAVAETGEGFDTIRDFDGYFLAMEDGSRVALAPDSRGRSLAAVFTAGDALERFLRRRRADESQPVSIGGRALFPLLGRLGVDGLVFNCAGPTAPQAFMLDFARAVMEA